MKIHPMVPSGLLAGVAAILAMVTMDYISGSYLLLLVVLTYFFYSIAEDFLKLSQSVTKKSSQT